MQKRQLIDVKCFPMDSLLVYFDILLLFIVTPPTLAKKTQVELDDETSDLLKDKWQN